MKATFVLMLFAACACAQTATAQDQSPESACGPANAHFVTQTMEKHDLTEPVGGKSQVYVIEVFDKVVGELGRPTLRVGVDGAWVGANKGNSYLSFSIDPGEHHLCANWQSRLKHLSSEAAFAGFTAEPGKTYYFRARITERGSAGAASSFSLDLDPVNIDEGKYLVASSAYSQSHTKR